MAFASIYVPNFILQAVLCVEPELRGRAISLLDGTSPLCSVVAVNDSAMRAGIEIGMTESQIGQFCGVEKRPRSRPHEAALHASLLQMGWSISPRMEDVAPDTIILDLAGLHSVFGSKKDIANEILWRASELGLTVNIAIAANIDVALHAARGFSGITLIPKGDEAKCLSCLPVSVLSPSLEVLETLERWGVSTCANLATLPILQLSERLGQDGVRLHELARGAKVRSLILAESERQFKEEMELDDAVEELEPLAFLLGQLFDQLCERLKAYSLAASAIQLRFDLGDAFEKEPVIREKISASGIAPKYYEKTMRLPVPMRDSKLLLNLLRLQLQSDPPQAPIVKITIMAEPARQRAAQNGLFRHNSIDSEKLELTIARLASLVGNSNVGSPEVMDTHRPGAFRMNTFVPAYEETKIRKCGHPTTTGIDGKNRMIHPLRTYIALRLFRPEWSAQIETREECPIRIYFRGMCGEIVAASGPWRTSGDWWREDTWRHDEWDIDVRFDSDATLMDLRWKNPNGLYRIVYDHVRRNWFVRGRYD